MNKRGFTLVEILAVITVLGIILAIAVPKIFNTSDESKEKIYESSVKAIEESSAQYVSNHPELISDESFILELSTLCNEKYLDCPLINPNTNADMIGYIYVTYEPGNDIYTYTYINSSSVRYILEVQLNGGSTTQTFEDFYDANSTIELIEPTKEDYRFNEWTVEGNSTIDNNILTISDVYTKIVANWASNDLSVIYNNNGGSGCIRKRVNYGSAYGTLCAPEREGYTFIGWYTAASGGTVITSSTNVTINGNHTIYAHWEANLYTILYTLNSGVVAGTNPTNYNIESDEITLTNPTKTGYTFTGWTGSNGTTPELTVKIPTGSTENKSYVANYSANTYTVTYNNNSGSGCTSKSVTYNSAYGTLCTPTRANYTFAGWYTAASGGTAITASTNVTTASNHTVYAHWNIITFAEYLISKSYGTCNTTAGICKVNHGSGDIDYRYIGLHGSVNNYITFNGESWRIIGVFKNQTSSTATPTWMVKIMTAGTKSDLLRWNGTGSSSAWEGSDVNIELNGAAAAASLKETTCSSSTTGYYGTLTATAKSMISCAKWYLGNLTSWGLSDAYTAERNTTRIDYSYVGLLYPTDYAYAGIPYAYWNNSTCTISYTGCRLSCREVSEVRTWMYQNFYDQYTTNKWFITPYNTTNMVYSKGSNSWTSCGQYTADIKYTGNTLNQIYAKTKPAIYLKSNTIRVSGTGSSGSPYTISLS